MSTISDEGHRLAKTFGTCATVQAEQTTLGRPDIVVSYKKENIRADRVLAFCNIGRCVPGFGPAGNIIS